MRAPDAKQRAAIERLQDNPDYEMVVEYLQGRLEESTSRLIYCGADDVVRLQGVCREDVEILKQLNLE